MWDLVFPTLYILICWLIIELLVEVVYSFGLQIAVAIYKGIGL